jgi:hypothetical protein
MNCLRSLERFDRGFEAHSRHGCLFVHLFCVCVVLSGSGLETGCHSSKESYRLFKKDYETEEEARVITQFWILVTTATQGKQTRRLLKPTMRWIGFSLRIRQDSDLIPVPQEGHPTVYHSVTESNPKHYRFVLHLSGFSIYSHPLIRTYTESLTVTCLIL